MTDPTRRLTPVVRIAPAKLNLTLSVVARRDDGFHSLHSVFAPGAMLSEASMRDTEEAGYVVSGRFDIEIGGIWHSLGEGDSFRFARKPFRWRNPGSAPAVVVWVVSPPVY